MFGRLEEMEQKYEEISKKLSDPQIVNNQTEFRKMMKEHSDMNPIVEKYRELKRHKKLLMMLFLY